jgi:hypothetical protein
MKAYQVIFPEDQLPTNNPYIGPPQVELPRLFLEEWWQCEEVHPISMVEKILTAPNARNCDTRFLSEQIATGIKEGFISWLRNRLGDDEKEDNPNQLFQQPASTRAGPCFSEDLISLNDIHNSTWPAEDSFARAYRLTAPANPTMHGSQLPSHDTRQDVGTDQNPGDWLDDLDDGGEE